MNCTPETQSPVTEIVCMLMQEFRFRPDDCLQVMQEATHIRNAPRARQFSGRLTESSDGYARIATAVGKTTANETDTANVGTVAAHGKQEI